MRSPIFFVRILFFSAITVLIIGSGYTLAQSSVFNDVRLAIKTGSAKELSKYMHTSMELSIDGEKNNYSQTQAEFVLRDFFKEYPSTEFQYIHQGSSGGGLKYAIGTYTYSNGSYRVVIRLKEVEGEYVLTTLDFTKD